MDSSTTKSHLVIIESGTTLLLPATLLVKFESDLEHSKRCLCWENRNLTYLKSESWWEPSALLKDVQMNFCHSLHWNSPWPQTKPLSNYAGFRYRLCMDYCKVNPASTAAPVYKCNRTIKRVLIDQVNWLKTWRDPLTLLIVSHLVQLMRSQLLNK